MFGKIKKSAFIVAFILIISLSVSVFAAAAGNSKVIVKFGDSALDMSVRVGDENRLYADSSVLFGALDATASYDSQAKTVTAVSGDTSVAFSLGDYSMTVTSAGAARTIDIDAAAFQDNAAGPIYIPVRYAAQALGFVVDWDGANSAVTLQSIDGLIAQSGATYTLIDRYLESQKGFSAKKHAVSGDFSMNLSFADLEDAPTVPMTINGTLSGLVNQSDAEMNIQMKTNASAFAAGLAGDEEMDDQDLMILSLLDDIDLNLIMNSKTGMLYIQSPLLTTLVGQQTGTWLSMDFSDLTSDVSLAGLTSRLQDSTSFKDYLSATLKELCLLDTGASAQTIRDTLALYSAMFGDTAFVKSGNDYVSTFTPDLGSDAEGLKMNMKTTLKFNGTAYAGMAIDVDFDFDGQGSMTMGSTADASGNGSVKLTMEIPSALTMDLTASFKYTDTAQAPASQPPAGSTIIPIDEMMSSNALSY
ncbi:Copper amine oxidase N-terminal domain-containing protein [Sporobacter termitidis DSM 10068]|uniref:Copper amine oxidase N-terminal domain-containing protein n=1 Tax=Sporobacter termitidis DSM 10068 TaxID=1123282 RepID=A0A1M5VP28_9FIRM|nr:copper amine oxidase N-terminal domain-containing protein [Sporobacter termitidis]SHH77016.1 Copper amine oxidase N-terminal domain-containing protein [Sporobacter termitidis DSM 10068]